MRTPPNRYLAGAGLAGLAVVAVGAWIAVAPDNTDGDADPESSAFATAHVERRDLTVGETVAGRLGFGQASPIPIRASGTVTWLPQLGMIARQGDVILEVDGRPVVLMYGTTPAFRAMSDGTTDIGNEDPSAEDEVPVEGDPDSVASAIPAPVVGKDVEQLERGLQALGYSGFTVDDEFTAATAEAVERWQTDLGIPADGQVQDGDIVFLPGPIRLQPDAAALGRPVSEASVQQSGTTKVVTVQTSESGLDWARSGTKVQISLPNQKKTLGTVADMASQSSDGVEGASAQEVTINLDRPNAKGLRPGQVTVTYVSAQAHDVLVVPVTALVALAEGGYGVQLADRTYVSVEPGLYAEGLVEVTSSRLREGTKVLVPQ